MVCSSKLGSIYDVMVVCFGLVVLCGLISS